uniref:Tlr 5Rp protein n=1 Tax=Tetrahymena thermophila TaxID=5911 RepID=Q8WRA5_TETTH|nr:Tlr 5Rp protein [Tetrahymena thermophila]
MSQKELVTKYSISQSSVTRLINQIKTQNRSSQQSVNQSQISQSQNSENNQSNEELEETNFQSENNEESSTEDNEQSKEEILSSKSIQNQSKDEEDNNQQILDHTLINYLNKPNDSIEIQKNKREKQEKQPIVNPQPIIQQPPAIIIQKQQPIQQIELQDQGDQETEIKQFMVKIRKFIQYFNKEQSIFHIIGSNDFQQRQFISRLYLKNLEELKLIHKSIEFELLFSRSNSFVQDSIESSALFIERLLLTIDINVVGVYQELPQDEEFQFNMKMFLCENSNIASAKQILFLKFVKNYYKKYSQNKNNTTTELKQKLKEQANQDLLERFNKL